MSRNPKNFDELIDRSSFGEPVARELQSRTPEQVVTRIRGHLRVISREVENPMPYISVVRSRIETREEEVNMSNKNRHIVPNPDGGWDVKKPGAQRASAHEKTQSDAEARAKEIVANQGGGEVVIHDRHGRIRDKDTVPPGNDPSPPRDRRH